MLLEKGVFDFDNLTHHGSYQAVKVIGWGQEMVGEEEKKFWLVESGWGEDWAEGGIGKVAMEHEDCLFGQFSVVVEVLGENQGAVEAEQG